MNKEGFFVFVVFLNFFFKDAGPFGDDTACFDFRGQLGFLGNINSLDEAF